MPSPTPRSEAAAAAVFQQFRQELVGELKEVMKAAQQESLNKHLKLINFQEELFLQTAMEQHRAQLRSQEALLSRYISNNNGIAPEVRAKAVEKVQPPCMKPPIASTPAAPPAAAPPLLLQQGAVKDPVEAPTALMMHQEPATEPEPALDATGIVVDEAAPVSIPIMPQVTDEVSELYPSEALGLSGTDIQASGNEADQSQASLRRSRSSNLLVTLDKKSTGSKSNQRENLLKEDGLCMKIVQSHSFHGLSVSMICFNAVYMGIEADWNSAKNLADASWYFQFFEHVFCLFFTVEVIITFGAFRRAKDCLKDGWFMLDFFMVVLMVIETWMFTLILAFVGGATAPNTGAVGGIGRLFRLLRLTRISKLMHALPELATMVKAMIAAVRAVHVALLILILLVYVFAIIMNVLIGNDSKVEEEFSSVRGSMVTLALSGVLMDDISGLTRLLISVGDVPSLMIFAVFVLLSALTVMNMLIGVLCEVVLDVSAEEKEKHVKEQMEKTLLVMLKKLDADQSGELSKAEVQSVICEPEAVNIMKDIQVDTQHLLDITEMVYEFEDSVLPISTIMNLVLSLRGKRSATMNDLAKGYNFMLWALEAKFGAHEQTVLKGFEELQSHGAEMHKTLMEHKKILSQPAASGAAAAEAAAVDDSVERKASGTALHQQVELFE